MTAIENFTGRIFVEGDTITIKFLNRKADGSVYDLTGISKVWFTAKKDYADPDLDALIGPLDSAAHPLQVSYGVAGPGAGIIQIKLLNADTAGIAINDNIYYDVQGLKGTDIITFVQGTLPFVHEVTQATS